MRPVFIQFKKIHRQTAKQASPFAPGAEHATPRAMIFRFFLAIWLIGALSVFAADRPNILLIMADDMRCG